MALKKYEAVEFLQQRSQTDRVDDDNVKKLLSLISQKGISEERTSEYINKKMSCSTGKPLHPPPMNNEVAEVHPAFE
jgi:hypothetical protein